MVVSVDSTHSAPIHSTRSSRSNHRSHSFTCTPRSLTRLTLPGPHARSLTISQYYTQLPTHPSIYTQEHTHACNRAHLPTHVSIHTYTTHTHTRPHIPRLLAEGVMVDIVSVHEVLELAAAVHLAVHARIWVPRTKELKVRFHCDVSGNVRAYESCAYARATLLPSCVIHFCTCVFALFQCVAYSFKMSARLPSTREALAARIHMNTHMFTSLTHLTAESLPSA